ncbi:MAG: hypothetical protein Q4G67_08820, partial [Actinomycetia bacterium]|nr:hypothetical protein [Actinomycetes bacterium]
TEVAQEVQRSAFPDAYGDHETEGRVVASTLAGHTEASMVCRLDAPTAPSDQARLLSDLDQHLGLTGRVSEDGSTLTLESSDRRTAWSVGQYLVAKADRHAITAVTVGDQQWTRASGRSALQWHSAHSPTAQTQVVAVLSPGGPEDSTL